MSGTRSVEMVRRYWPLLAATVLAGAMLMRWHALFGEYLYEDAYIAYRFSDNWARGLGPTWNPGLPPLEGFTSFSWVALGAIGQVLGAPPETFLPIVSAACWVTLVGLLVPGAALIAGVRPWVALVGAVAVGALVQIAIQIFAGLETVLAVAAVVSVSAAALAFPRASPRWLVAASVLAVFTRPDASVVVALTWGLAWWLADGGDRRRLMRAAAVLLAIGLVYELGRFGYYGDWVPNTFHVKRGSSGAGIRYVRSFAVVASPLVGLWLLAALARGPRALLGDRRFLLLAVPALSFVATFLGIDPVQGKAFRFLVPVYPALILATLVAGEVAAQGARRRVRLVAPALAALVALGVTGWFDWRYAGREHEGLRRFFLGVRVFHVELGRKLGDLSHLEPTPVLATADVGAIPYYTRLPTIDLAGLCDRTIAVDGLTHEYLAEVRPDILLLQDLTGKRTRAREEVDAGPGQRLPIWHMKGRYWTLETKRHKRLRGDPAHIHTGLASTYQVVTAPGFATDYEHVADWNFIGVDRYYVFVRSEHPARDEIARAFRGVRPERLPRPKKKG